MPDHDRGHRVAEDYVAAIAVLEAEGTPAIGARLAEALHVSAPTVTETLRRLEQNGFLHVEANKDLNLTATGRELATRTLRRRRLVERFLVDSLGLPLTDAQVEADRIEHGLSETAADRLDQALGHPAECPHGYQIAESNLPSSALLTLDRAPRSVDLVVECVTTELSRDDRLLDQLHDVGVRPGSRIVVLAFDNDHVLIQSAHGEGRVPISSARQVQVRKAKSQREKINVARGEPRYRIQVTAVQGTCLAGHHSGDSFEFTHCTPAGLCLDALQRLYPAMSALKLGGPAPSRIEVPCPDDGVVTFTVERDVLSTDQEDVLASH